MMLTQVAFLKFAAFSDEIKMSTMREKRKNPKNQQNTADQGEVFMYLQK
ncbi:hypothetical protein [Thalassomonas haliotis]|uniref:Uncharacterized protein n=1 Tax=Thalassomonas haliotis TaxID=485448 RepID=A0ABY7VI23_9GAMM|nr:hypothetical protein [Thalassomonas haliotis]WDE12312.1 hypothetical protein H3N35_02160 [Thalassomonas haliotis]